MLTEPSTEIFALVHESERSDNKNQNILYNSLMDRNTRDPWIDHKERHF